MVAIVKLFFDKTQRAMTSVKNIIHFIIFLIFEVDSAPNKSRQVNNRINFNVFEDTTKLTVNTASFNNGFNSVSNLEREYNEEIEEAQRSADFNPLKKDHSFYEIETTLSKFIRRTVRYTLFELICKMDRSVIQSIDEENIMNGKSKKMKREDQIKDDGPIGSILTSDGETQMLMGTFQAIMRPGTLNLPNIQG
ncbi:unnamed protein product [Arctia plantaginis]|uniref:Uncharacterized protein n=1 Tax=Arctia plantaginis TaxID=874455 RepID=A0A8S0YSR9_ARCPL|nr:unnamed protein product [Arctia plantaginis]